MKASRTALALSLLASGTLAIGACVPAPDSTPAPSPGPVAQAPSPTPTPRPAPAAPPAVAFENWIDAPRTPGNWSFATSGLETLASFGEPGGEPMFALSCDRRSREITIIRSAGAPRNVQTAIRTETADRALSMSPASGGSRAVETKLPAQDPIFDAIALTRGRFAVETPGLSTLYLPAWAEVTRVIEDCR